MNEFNTDSSLFHYLAAMALRPDHNLQKFMYGCLKSYLVISVQSVNESNLESHIIIIMGFAGRY